MLEATFHFPRGFLWGSAASSHQVEGYNTNNQWWNWELQPGRIKNGDRSEAACSWWSGRWKDDFDRAAECDQNAFRFSIEWSRVQPVRAHWDETAIDRYREMARGLKERDMTALVTLHHFSDPLWLAEEGGWENPEVIDLFAAYVLKMTESLKEYVSLWVTINEPNTYAFASYLSGVFPPGEHNFGKAGRVLANMARAHAAAFRIIKGIQPNARVGIAHCYQGIHPKQSWSPLDRFSAHFANRCFNHAFADGFVRGVLEFPYTRVSLPEIVGTQDFFGLSHSNDGAIHFDPAHPNPCLQIPIDPGERNSDEACSLVGSDGFVQALSWSRRYRLPVIITASSLDSNDDDARLANLMANLHQVWRAIQLTKRIEGYFHWSLVDSFEWHAGWNRRFGLWELDVDTQKRHKRVSADLYAEICKNNAISAEMVKNYTPELMGELFPQ